MRTDRTCRNFASPRSRPVTFIGRFKSCLSLKNIRLPGSLMSGYALPSSVTRASQNGAASLSSFAPSLSRDSASGTTFPENSEFFGSAAVYATNRIGATIRAKTRRMRNRRIAIPDKPQSVSDIPQFFVLALAGPIEFVVGQVAGELQLRQVQRRFLRRGRHGNV